MPSDEDQNRDQTTPEQATDTAAPADDTAAPSDAGTPDQQADDGPSWDEVFESAVEGGNPGDEGDRADLDPETKQAAEQDADDQEGEYEDGEQPKADDKDAKADDQQSDEDDEAELTRDLTDEELARFKPRTSKRIKALMKDRAELRDQLTQVQEAARYGDPVRKAIQEDGLSNENITELLSIGRTLRHGDFAKFAQMVRPYLEMAQQATGEKLPQDLQAKVDDGEITPELASEVAQRRHQAQVAEQRAQREQQLREQGEQTQRQQAQVNTVRDAFNEWESDLLSSDPDYEQIRAAVHERVQLEIKANGVPQDASAAKDLAKRAYEGVKKLASPAPRRKPTAPRPSSGGSNPGAASAKSANPESLDDIIESNLGG